MAERPRLGALIRALVAAERANPSAVGAVFNLGDYLRELRAGPPPPPPPPPADEDVSPPRPPDLPELPGDVVDPDAPPPPPRTDAENYPYPVQPGTTAFLPRESQTPKRLLARLPQVFAGLGYPPRTPARSTRKKPRGSSAGSAARRRTPRARIDPLGLAGWSGLAGSALSFRGPPVRPPGAPGEPYPIVTDPRGPVLFPSTRRQREGSPRTLEEAIEQLHRTNPFDINPLPPLPPPRRIITPSTPQTSPPAPEVLPMPQPSIPAPRPVQPAPLPMPSAPNLPLPMPRPPPPIAPPRPFKPAPVRIQTPGIGLATVGLSAILRRKTQETTSLLRQFTAPFDPVLQPVGDVAPPTIGDVLPQPLPPTIARPDLVDDNPLDLTRRNEMQLGLRPRDRREREECCKCEDEEDEEEKKTPRPSRVIATVKSFARRMSQNSLDNLR